MSTMTTSATVLDLRPRTSATAATLARIEGRLDVIDAVLAHIREDVSALRAEAEPSA